MKIAMFKRLGEHSYESVQTSDFETIKGFIRLTEYVEVEFHPLRDETVVEKHLKALDDAESEVRIRFQQALQDIEQQRQELRAITYTPAAS
jgi:hypothetical protein